ncbi:FAD:protein FMN transferase [Pseudoduganella armeniaca]|uniref:FAD:protein FMN transferase n=1 Tax=Pseudoduganella armeniaca TaxID=2072590 RepID=A0A2R4CEE0_9BURK|nr:FAD:protein FMN transferase [Pseudoduganella armeniaca]AVR97995.1 thiamine biosynthesis protein ApbE [Pseudoduganella armeniaca]
MRRVLLPHAISSAAPPAGAAIHDHRGTSMGTGWSARVVGAAPDLAPLLQAELDLVVAQMSHWEPTSDLGRFNRAPAGTWHALPAEFLEVLAFALDVCDASGGACDPCAGALVNLWGFGPVNRHDQPGFVPPTPAQVQAALAQRAHVRLDPHTGQAWQPGGVQLDLSAIAKGYAVDRLALRLESLGIADYLVEVGGELRGGGVKPDGQPWWVALEQPPDAAAGDDIVVALHGLAVATSGDYRRYFVDGAGRRPHTIDPRTGLPIDSGIAAVTVVDASCMAADAWSTALTVLGVEAGLRLAERRGIAARFLVRQGDGTLRASTSSAFAAMLD